MSTQTVGRHTRIKGRSNLVFKRDERVRFIAWFELIRKTGMEGKRSCKINEKYPFPTLAVQQELKGVFHVGWKFVPTFDEKNKIVRIRYYS